jgi:hypothetical protein
MKYYNIMLLSLILGGCAATPHMPGAIVLTKGHVTTDHAKGGVKKTGKSCTKNFLGIVSVGDASIEAARKNGKIKKISFIDNSYKNILGIYQEYCTLVRGR